MAPAATAFTQAASITTPKDFELKVDIMTLPGANGGVYIDTENQGQGFPLKGFEVQVNITYVKDPRKTGSLCQVKDNGDEVAKDNQCSLNTSSPRETPLRSKWTTNRWCSGPSPRTGQGPGIFRPAASAQARSRCRAMTPGSTVYYKNIRIKILE